MKIEKQVRLSELWNNVAYRRPCWSRERFIRVHNGRWFTDQGNQVDEKCIEFMKTFDDWEKVDKELECLREDLTTSTLSAKLTES